MAAVLPAALLFGLAAGSSGPPRRGGRLFFRRLRGDLPAAHTPGLAPSPGRWWLRTSVLVPSAPCRPSVSAAASRFRAVLSPVCGGD
ncbi:hypothetical protein F7Q99_05920 [Streptomyces kaniharaensis]|uniref:Uncharacterized protein n=1 Tax=Streptomyces kaniharaensis TaxID=212423 RepID=A0A6N7KN17_9ACTN|nr:hypothetical protein [Streptomyces kaniharaensis]